MKGSRRVRRVSPARPVRGADGIPAATVRGKLESLTELQKTTAGQIVQLRNQLRVLEQQADMQVGAVQAYRDLLASLEADSAPQAESADFEDDDDEGDFEQENG